MNKAAIYARVSTNDQTNKNQIISLRAYAERVGLDIVAEFEDTVSGAKFKRDGLDQLLEGARRRHFNTVLVWSLDRLGRSLVNVLNVVEELRAVGVNLWIEKQGIDTTTPMGNAMLQMSGIFAELEREFIRERTRAGLQRARAQGKRLGRPPAPESTLDAIRDLRAQGLGMNKIANQLSCGKRLVQKICQEFDKQQKGEA